MGMKKEGRVKLNPKSNIFFNYSLFTKLYIIIHIANKPHDIEPQKIKYHYEDKRGMHEIK